ncbi:endoplasmic reticulum lectin 1-like [Clavelina lepadiformis]|uniref:Endoplasmic reticulum lectin 1 n=1 Tax=Clavelina lepadiformis TaxID=159417 RepID=A0ABP0EWT0_CLALP
MWLKAVWLFMQIHFIESGQPFSALKDDISFRINWPGRHANIEKLAPPGLEYNSDDTFIITSVDNERYSCTVPTISITDLDGDISKDDLLAKTKAPHELLAPLFKSTACSQRIEAYWTYELCHGKHIRQFHEERVRKSGTKQESTVVYETEDGQKIVLHNDDDQNSYVKSTEFFLGYFTNKIDKNGLLIDPVMIPTNEGEVTRQKINGVKTPYYAVNMTDGTPCDIKSGSGRRSKVIYVCGPGSRNEIISVSETSSCEYELVVLTPELCKNPLYNLKGKQINEVQCIPLDNAPVKPSSLVKQLQQQPKDFPRSQSSNEKDLDDTPRKNEMRKVQSTTISTLVDKSLLKEFLSGVYCLRGGTGWWRFEYCYGKHVTQYHDDNKLGRTTIYVGKWDGMEHLKWVKSKAGKPRLTVEDKDKLTVTQVSHYYGNGDVCEETGKAREVVVRMKCKKNAQSPHSVTLFLLEPRTCSYILGIESLIICDLLDSSDENGLFTTDP